MVGQPLQRLEDSEVRDKGKRLAVWDSNTKNGKTMERQRKSLYCTQHAKRGRKPTNEGNPSRYTYASGASANEKFECTHTSRLESQALRRQELAVSIRLILRGREVLDQLTTEEAYCIYILPSRAQDKLHRGRRRELPWLHRKA